MTHPKMVVRLIDPDTFSFHLDSREHAERVARRYRESGPGGLVYVGDPYFSEPDNGWYIEFELPGHDAR